VGAVRDHEVGKAAIFFSKRVHPWALAVWPCAWASAAAFLLLNDVRVANSSREAAETVWVEHLTAAKQAERELHSACDSWNQACRLGQPTCVAARRIIEAYKEFYSHARQLRVCTAGRAGIIFIATGACPSGRILSAGSYTTRQEGKWRRWSYVVWLQKKSIYVTVWERSEHWTCYIPASKHVWFEVRMGAVSASSKLPVKEDMDIQIEASTWSDPLSKTLIELRCRAGPDIGVIRIHRTEKGWNIEQAWQQNIGHRPR